MPQTVLLLMLWLFFNHAQAHTLKNHSWVLSDMANLHVSQEEIKNSLRSKWDHEASSEDLAHLYAFQFFKKFKLTTAKIFLFTGSTPWVSTVLNDSNQLLTFDPLEKSFLPLHDWILKRAENNCSELIHPSDQVIFLMQINRFKPSADHCYYMLVPSHVYQQIELYPFTTPKELLHSDVVDACYHATDRKLFKKDKKRCESWVKNFN